MNIFKYFRFAKEITLYQNNNYVGSNENALIYIMDAAHKTIEIGEETLRSSHDKGVASDKRCNIYSPTLDTSYNAFCAKKTVHFLDYIGAELVRIRVY